MTFFEKGEIFPPIEHQDRIHRYKENKKLFEGKHWELFRKHNVNKSHKLYVSANLAGIISKKSADFLIGDGVTISAGKEDNSPEQMAMERFKEDNDLDILFYESALSNAFRGDSFFKVRYGQEHGGEYPKEFDEPRVRIETVNPEYVFPETAKHNRKKAVAYHIAIPTRVDNAEDVKKKDNFKLQVESHYAGSIVYHDYYLTVLTTEADGTPIEYKIGEPINEPEGISTGINFPMVVHVPNFSVDDDWQGMDDLYEVRSLMDELNNRLSQIADIMDKHSNPAIAVPPNTMVEDDNGRPMFRVADSKVFEVDKQDIMPQYITWNGQLQEAYTEIDRLISLILTTAEIPEVALGMGDSGTSGGSGLSIKWRMNSLLSKINRKRKYYEKGLKNVFMIAQMIEKELGIADYQVTTPKLEFTDGLPKDELEQTNIAIQKTGGAVLQSQKTAIMQLSGLTEEQAEAEISKIEDEQEKQREAEAEASPSLFNDMPEDEQPQVEDDEQEEEQG